MMPIVSAAVLVLSFHSSESCKSSGQNKRFPQATGAVSIQCNN